MEFEALLKTGRCTGILEVVKAAFLNLLTETFIVLQDEHSSDNTCSQEGLEEPLWQKAKHVGVQGLIHELHREVDARWCYDFLREVMVLLEDTELQNSVLES